MNSLPPSGIWCGETVQLSLGRQGACGERIETRSSSPQPFSAVLFFDEDQVFGHAQAREHRLTLNGWWGPATHLRPTLLELVETDLWEGGEFGMQLCVMADNHEETYIAWLHENEIAGYGRYDGP